MSRTTRGHGRLHVHLEAVAPRGRQDPRPVDGSVLDDHAAAPRWEGAVRWSAVRARWRRGRSRLRLGLCTPGRSSPSSPTTCCGRVKVYEAIVKGENIPEPGIPESFKVLIKEMQALCLNVRVR